MHARIAIFLIFGFVVVVMALHNQSLDNQRYSPEYGQQERERIRRQEESAQRFNREFNEKLQALSERRSDPSSPQPSTKDEHDDEQTFGLENDPRGKAAIEAFDSYCMTTMADYVAVQALAKAKGLQSIPKMLEPLVITERANHGAGFLVDKDLNLNSFIALGVSEPAACTVVAEHVDVANLRRQLIARYYLKSALAQETGLTTLQVFVPDGTDGSVQEALLNGLVTIKYDGELTEASAISVTYAPPETVAASMSGSQ